MRWFRGFPGGLFWWACSARAWVLAGGLVLLVASCSGQQPFTQQDKERHASYWKLYRAEDAGWPAAREKWVGEGPRSAGVLVQSVMLDLVTSYDRNDLASHARARRELVALQPTSIPYLVEGLRPAEDVVRKMIAEVLVLIGEPAVKTLLPLLGSEDPEVRRVVASTLGQIGSPAAAGAIAGTAEKDEDWRVRAASVTALASCGGGADAAPTLLHVLGSDPDPFVRGKAAVALASVSGSSATEALMRALRAARGRARDPAVVAGGEEAVRGLNGEVHEICHALAMVTGRDFGTDTGRWIAWWEGRK